MRKHRDHLEELVEERTLELQESLDNLKLTQRLLAEASHQAGMAEVAKSVLHNVGNVVSSVNTASQCIQDILTRFAVQMDRR